MSALGIYPLKTVICGEVLDFYTVGNVATDMDYTGRGHMSRLMALAMDKLNELGADGSRLGGKRERYNRYGYESAGTVNFFVFTKDATERLSCSAEIDF